MIDLQKKYGYLSDEAWRDLLVSSSRGEARSFQLPGFPSAEIQAMFVGSSYADALSEAFNFYKYFKSACAARDLKFVPSLNFLDFGCGWGRFLRFFGKDISSAGMFGVDIDPDILKVCADTDVPGHFERIEPAGHLSLKDGSIDIAIAYSVFTHLPENIHLHWMKEIARVMKSGAMFALTLEPRRFLDFVANETPKGTSGW